MSRHAPQKSVSLSPNTHNSIRNRTGGAEQAPPLSVRLQKRRGPVTEFAHMPPALLILFSKGLVSAFQFIVLFPVDQAVLQPYVKLLNTLSLIPLKMVFSRGSIYNGLVRYRI